MTSMPAPSMSCMKNHGIKPAHSHRIYGGAPASPAPLPTRSPISRANQKQKMYIAGLMKNHDHDSTAPRLFFTSSNRARRPICLRHAQLSFNIVPRVLKRYSVQNTVLVNVNITISEYEARRYGVAGSATMPDGSPPEDTTSMSCSHASASALTTHKPLSFTPPE